MISFPEKLKKTTLTYKEKRILRKKKLTQSNNYEASLSTSTVSSSENTIESSKDATGVNKRTLFTINEACENSDEYEIENFDKLDSISNKLDVINTQSNLFVIADSVSSNFSSRATNSVASLSGNDDIEENKFIKNATSNDVQARTFSQYFRDKLIHFRWKITGFFKTLLNLLFNLRYSLLVLIISVECILIASFTSYMILYSQHIYQLTSSNASTLVGGGDLKNYFDFFNKSSCKFLEILLDISFKFL